ncbi:MAG: DUF3995 domain-containing protein [Solirubrobacterales bacterium]|nr:DUF3995 domain-containing protein [Solirubrobacterales bacterium]
MRATGLPTRVAATGLLGIAGLHVLWATGTRWPAGGDGGSVSGRSDGRSPSAASCLAVAAALGAAAAFVAGRPRSRPGLSRLGAAGVVATLATRGGLGMAGQTKLIAPGTTTERFRELDRALYSPLCLAHAALASPAAFASPRRNGA